jgi:hypothetical protein
MRNKCPGKASPVAISTTLPWRALCKTITTVDLGQSIIMSSSNPMIAAKELKSTHFKIEDPSISRHHDGLASESITKTDFVPYPEAKREKLHKTVVQPYPVIYRDPNINPEKQSLYKADFDIKV